MIAPVYPKLGNGRPPIGLERDAAHLFPAAMVALLLQVNMHLLEELAAHLVKISKGTIVDATIINAPNSTKNAIEVGGGYCI